MPARFRVKASYERSIWPVFVCLVYLTLLGCPVSIERANVDLDLDVGGKRYSATTSDWVLAGIYYNTNAPRPALGSSLHKAVLQIAADIQGAPAQP